MHAVALNSATLPESPVVSATQKPGGRTPSAAASAAEPADTVQLSPAGLREVGLTGRIAMNEDAGAIGATQAQQLYSQVSSIHSQIVADKQADGGTLSPTDAQTIRQLQGQLSQSTYGDAHNGAAPPADPNVTQAGARQDMEAGRIALNVNAGNLSSAQAQPLSSQLGTIQQQIVADEQANGGTLSTTDAQAINQLQNQLSQQIYDTAHGGAASQATVKPA
jgi:hypothetical protein